MVVPAKEIAKESGLNPIVCGNCGNKIKTKDAIDSFFSVLLEKIKEGEKVILPSLGTFSSYIRESVMIVSPMIPGGRAASKEQKILTFRAGARARRFLNPEIHDK